MPIRPAPDNLGKVFLHPPPSSERGEITLVIFSKGRIWGSVALPHSLSRSTTTLSRSAAFPVCFCGRKCLLMMQRFVLFQVGVRVSGIAGSGLRFPTLAAQNAARVGHPAFRRSKIFRRLRHKKIGGKRIAPCRHRYCVQPYLLSACKPFVRRLRSNFPLTAETPLRLLERRHSFFGSHRIVIAIRPGTKAGPALEQTLGSARRRRRCLAVR